MAAEFLASTYTNGRFLLANSMGGSNVPLLLPWLIQTYGDGELPVQQIEDIIAAEGHVVSGVLEIRLARQDIGDVQGIWASRTIRAKFQIGLQRR
jgi:hypothetical protein